MSITESKKQKNHLEEENGIRKKEKIIYDKMKKKKKNLFLKKKTKYTDKILSNSRNFGNF